MQELMSHVDPLSPERLDAQFVCLIFKQNSVIDILNISSEVVFKWMPHNHIDNKSTVVQARA